MKTERASATNAYLLRNDHDWFDPDTDVIACIADAYAQYLEWVGEYPRWVLMSKALRDTLEANASVARMRESGRLWSPMANCADPDHYFRVSDTQWHPAAWVMMGSTKGFVLLDASGHEHQSFGSHTDKPHLLRAEPQDPPPRKNLTLVLREDAREEIKAELERVNAPMKRD